MDAGDQQHSLPPPPPQPHAPPPPSPGDRSPYPSPPAQPALQPRRRWSGAKIAAVTVGSVVAVGAVLLVFAYALEHGPLTHDLLDEDFSSSDGTFFTGESPSGGYRSEVVDGRYRLSTQAADIDMPLETFAFFERRAWNVDIEADVVDYDIDDGFVGLECAHEASGRDGAGERYAFLVGTPADDDESRYVLVFVESSLLDQSPQFTSAGGPRPRPGQRIGLHCDGSQIVGLVDGEEVVSLDEPIVDSFEAAALVFGTWGEGDWVEYDEVVAEVPEH